MRVIVGLGNPEPEYAGTRHNAGFLLADGLADRWRLPPFGRAPYALAAQGRVGGVPLMVLKPQTYMNLSGEALLALRNLPAFVPARDLLILVDDAALPLGTFRIRAQGSSGGHNGLESVEQALESRDYPRLRIGIGPVPQGLEDLADFVLRPFIPEEAAVLRDLIPSMAEAVDCWIVEGIEPAINRYNRRAGDPTKDGDDEQIV